MTDDKLSVDKLREEVETLRDKIMQQRRDMCDSTLNDVTNSVSHLHRIQFKAKRTLKGHLSKVVSCNWARDSKHLVSASHDGKLMVWDAHSTHKIHAIPMKSAWVMSCSFSQKTARFVASGGLDNVCTVYALQARKDNTYTSQEFSAHTGYMSCCRFIDDTEVITASGDATAALWDVTTGKLKTIYYGHSSDVMSVSVAPDKRTFITGACDATARLWDIRDGLCRQSFAGSGIDVNVVVFHPTNLSFACLGDMEDQEADAGAESCMCLFDLRSDNKIGETRAFRFSYTSMDFTKSGRLAVVGTCADPSLINPATNTGPSKMIVYDVLKFDEKNATRIEKAHDHTISQIHVSYDGSALCSASNDTLLKIWTAGHPRTD
ncbi:guanine nucleotide-binding protein subunit beta-like [Convolutriloba macropyga]|uniref:guanine nucleotide-binding protein subunit beta-like n=1 Tax=Convolutriloba macropyga TaxID=536237 RepID=UPI003F5205BB